MSATAPAAVAAPTKTHPDGPSNTVRNFDQLPDAAQLRLRDIAAILNVGAATVWRRAAKEPAFPQPRRIGPKCTRWTAGDVRRYLAAAPRSVRGGPPEMVQLEGAT